MTVLAFAVGLALGLILGGVWSVVRLRRPRHRHTWGKWGRITVTTPYYNGSVHLRTEEVTKQHRHCMTCNKEEVSGI